jgi:molybdopterin-guanine dinucleotide biosynthesis protein B
MRVIGLAGWSGAGKTTLLARLIPVLRGQGLSVSTLKHAHHAFDVDHPGKDSHTHRIAGASEVLVASARRWALMHELRDEPEPGLAELLQKLSPVDLVIVEGFKRERHRKLEVHRLANGKPPLWPHDPGIVAVATDAQALDGAPLRLHLDDCAGIATFMAGAAQPLEEALRDLACGPRGADDGAA